MTPELEISHTGLTRHYHLKLKGQGQRSKFTVTGRQCSFFGDGSSRQTAR